MDRKTSLPKTLKAHFFAVTLASLTFAGCHSAFVQATIDNQSSSAVRLVEVDYPSASFGVSNLAAKSQFHYRFKIQGSGALKLEYTDPDGKVRDFDGPVLKQGQEGDLTVVIHPDGSVSWQPELATLK
jgi:hypothetical protein